MPGSAGVGWPTPMHVHGRVQHLRCRHQRLSHGPAAWPCPNQRTDTHWSSSTRLFAAAAKPAVMSQRPLRHPWSQLDLSQTRHASSGGSSSISGSGSSSSPSHITSSSRTLVVCDAIGGSGSRGGKVIYPCSNCGTVHRQYHGGCGAAGCCVGYAVASRASDSSKAPFELLHYEASRVETSATPVSGAAPSRCVPRSSTLGVTLAASCRAVVHTEEHGLCVQSRARTGAETPGCKQTTASEHPCAKALTEGLARGLMGSGASPDQCGSVPSQPPVDVSWHVSLPVGLSSYKTIPTPPLLSPAGKCPRCNRFGTIAPEGVPAPAPEPPAGRAAGGGAGAARVH